MYGDVTGLVGRYMPLEDLTMETGSNKMTLSKSTNLFWQMRWDDDAVKGPARQRPIWQGRYH